MRPIPGSADPAPARADLRRDVRRRERARRRAALVTAAVIAVLAGAVVLTVSAHLNDRLRPDVIPTHAADGVIATGSPTAPLTVDVTAAYGCTGCTGVFADLAGPLEQAKAVGAARVRYHLTAARDPQAADDRQVTPDTARVANALACASDISTETAANLWSSVIPYPLDAVTDDSLMEAAARIGISAPTFHGCVTNGTYTDWVTQRAATDPAATPTPTFRLNGAATTPAALTAALNNALREVRTTDAAPAS